MSELAFPGPISAWSFCTTLSAFLAVAAYTDQRHMLVPKWLTLPLLALGFLANLVRGAILGHQGHAVFCLEPSGWLTGGLDGLLFSLAGFAVAFSLFFVLFVLGTCSGGDVKLFAALGSWIGPTLVVLVLVGTLVILVLFVLLQMIRFTVLGRVWTQLRTAIRVRRGEEMKPAESPGAGLLRYSLVVFVVTLPLLFWVCRTDLRLVGEPGQAAGESGEAILAQTSPERLTRTRRGRGRQRRRRGSLTVELLLVLPILLGLVWGMVQFSLLQSAQQRLVAASREGARIASLGASMAEVQNAARLSLGSGVLNQASIGLRQIDGMGRSDPMGVNVEVTVRIPVEEAVPNLLAFLGMEYRGEQLTARTVMRRE